MSQSKVAEKRKDGAKVTSQPSGDLGRHRGG